MSDYQRYITGEITIHKDPSRIEGQWYARVPLYCQDNNEYQFYKRLLGRQKSLEITLEKPGLIKSTRKIITELQRRGISTTILRIKPYQK